MCPSGQDRDDFVTRHSNGLVWTAGYRPPLFDSNEIEHVPRLTKFALPLLKFEVCSRVPGSTTISYWNRSHAMEVQTMVIGERLRALREQKKFSQGEVEKRTGLLRCYISRVENGHTVPAVETLEKFAHALEVPMYQLFYDGEEPPKLPNLPKRKTAEDILWGSKGKDARMLAQFCRLFSKMEEDELRMVLFIAQKMARRN
jgi:transcriptional regulator with XRE-family HTH domain